VSSLALTLLLVVSAEPTPPPLVPVPPEAPEEADAGVPAEPPLPVLAQRDAQLYGNPASRVFLVTLSGAATTAATFGVSIWLANNVTTSSGDRTVLTLLSVPMTLMVCGAVVTGVTRKLDGQGSLWSHIGGMAIGAGAGLLIWALGTNFQFSTDTTTTIGIGTASALLAGLGGALMGELSHWRWWRENHPEVTLLPTKGGATASFGWSF
jgi:hypothetical protein